MIAEVWCVNDASNAVGVVNGESYCATCIVYAEAEAAKAREADRYLRSGRVDGNTGATVRAAAKSNLCDCGKGEWCPQYGAAFLAARDAAKRKTEAEAALASVDPKALRMALQDADEGLIESVVPAIVMRARMYESEQAK